MLTPTVLMVFAAGGLMMLALFMVTLAAAPNSKRIAAQRLERVRDRAAPSQNAMARAQMRKLLMQRQSNSDNYLSGIIPNRDALLARLSRTGRDITLTRYVAISVGVGVGVALLLIVLLHAPVVLALLIGGLAGLGGPHLAVGFMVSGRIKKFIASFPDAIDLLVRGLRAGLPITEAIGIAGKELPDPVGYEFRTVADRMRIGKTLDAALQDTTKRINVPEFQFFVIALAVQRETGGNLAETLGNLSDVLRKRMQMKLKINAMSSEAKASAYIVGALPFAVFAMISIMNPQYVAPFTSDIRLMIAGGGALTWMGIGVFIMWRMVNFEI